MANPKEYLSRAELVGLLAVDEEFLVLLEREQVVTGDPTLGYTHAAAEQVRICHSLYHELGVNLPGLDVALRLLETIRAERAQFEQVLAWLRSQLDEPSTETDAAPRRATGPETSER